jgi:hypothetical protein
MAIGFQAKGKAEKSSTRFLRIGGCYLFGLKRARLTGEKGIEICRKLKKKNPYQKPL